MRFSSVTFFRRLIFALSFAGLSQVCSTATALATTTSNHIPPDASSEPDIIVQAAPVTLPTPTVSELSDVQPTDWAYQALVRLDEQYGVLSGYPDGTFRGSQSLTRYEFAAALSQVLEQILALTDSLSSDDLAVLDRLQQEFAPELSQVAQSVDDLEVRAQQLTDQQVSTTVRFSGQLLMAATAGGYGGDKIIAPRGTVVTEDSPESIFLNRVSLFFNASFREDDLLQIRLVSGSNGPNDNVAGTLEPNFGSTLDYATQGRNNSFSLARAYYSFYPLTDLKVVIAPLGSIADFVDNNQALPASFEGFSTQAMASNFILLPRPFGSGAVADWNPGGGDWSLRAAYVAGDASDNTGENERLFGGGGTDDVRLFPTGGGASDSGLFGDPHQGFVELEYAPSSDFGVRFQYAGGQIFGSDFDGVGIDAELAVSPQMSFFGRYSYSSYSNTTVGDLTPQYWVAGFTYRDLFKQDDLSGFAITQPFIENQVGNATQTNLEAFYNYPIAERLTIAPFSQVVINPANQSENGTIVVGGIRSVFSF